MSIGSKRLLRSVGHRFASYLDKCEKHVKPIALFGTPRVRPSKLRSLRVPLCDLYPCGSDAFLATGQPPKVAVCGQRYVFNAADDLDPRAPCPPGNEPIPIADAQHPTQLAPAVASQSDLMAYQNDDPIARKIEESFRGVH